MNGGLIALLVVLGVVVLLGIYVWATYNSLVTLRVRVDEAWSDITVQLKRRADLIPNIVEAVKGYASHEKGVFEAVTAARAETISAQSPGEAAVAENHMQQALKSIFAVAEAYPQLQASQNFLQLQSELVDTETTAACASTTPSCRSSRTTSSRGASASARASSSRSRTWRRSRSLRAFSSN